MPSTKIVLIGVGSTSFGVDTLADLFARRAHLRGTHSTRIALCDLDGAKLARITRLAERMNAATDANFEITGATDYRNALADAEFVVVSVELDRLARWKLDWEIPRQYGIRHVLGENGGPGALTHSLRVIDLVLGIAREIEARAPNAYLLNYSNPMSRVMLALTRYTDVRAVGLCHQGLHGYFAVAHTLGISDYFEPHWHPASIARALQEKLSLQMAGVNHLTWIQALRERSTGRDLYPEFRARLRTMPPTFEPLSRRLCDAFGLYPATGDGHAGEYFSFAYETSDLRGYDFDAYAARGAELDARVDRANQSPDVLNEFLAGDTSERAARIITGLLNDSREYEIAVNVVNHGALPGLPDWAVVEVPGIVTANGILPLRVQALPPAITAHLDHQIAIQDRVVEAAVHGDRNAALQALLLDPLVTSFADAEKMLDELLAAHKDYLPAFNKR
jgi:alpha-galactosidase